MYDWKSKKKKKAKNGSQTSGRTKGENCHASTLDRHFAKRSRSYKHPDYSEWVAKTRYNKIKA